ncbi:MAG: hypothetical protein ACR2P5_04145 [Gammaproteobacteria bacterium]
MQLIFGLINAAAKTPGGAFFARLFVLTAADGGRGFFGHCKSCGHCESCEFYGGGKLSAAVR